MNSGGDEAPKPSDSDDTATNDESSSGMKSVFVE